MAAFNIMEIAPRLHLINLHRKVRRSHLVGQHLFQAPGSGRALEEKAALRVGIQRSEEGHALYVVPMKVGDKDVCGKRAVSEFALQLLAQDAESCAAIEYVDTVTEAHFDAGGIASIAHVLGFWRWRGTAHAPELDPHRLVAARELLPWTLSLYLPMMGRASQLPDWFTAQYFAAIPRLFRVSPIMNREVRDSGGPQSFAWSTPISRNSRGWRGRPRLCRW